MAQQGDESARTTVDFCTGLDVSDHTDASARPRRQVYAPAYHRRGPQYLL
jgi:hypothetical protein